jgi:hypothetical protein
MMVMAEAAVWDRLTRLEQRALIKLFGGGTLRNNDPRVVDRLRAAGFVDENDGLAMAGLFVLTLAMRRQQAYERSRTGVTLATDHLVSSAPSAFP